MRRVWTLALTAFVGALLAGAADAQTSVTGSKAGIAWVGARIEMPKKREAGVAADGPLAGPKVPTILDVGFAARQERPLLLYFYWPGVTGPGKACMKLRDEILREPVVALATGDFYCARINGKKAPKSLLKQYRVRRFPLIQIYTCDRKLVAAIGSASDPEAFARKLKSYIQANIVVAKKMAAKRRKLKAMFDKGEKLRADGKRAEARKQYAKLIKQDRDSEAADDAKWALREMKMEDRCAEGVKHFEAANYYAARSLFQIVSDFELPCDARSKARELLPDCEAGIKFQDAEKFIAEGNRLKAIGVLQAIIDDKWYEGPFKARAAAKIKELQENWGK